jgi:hypothetical protein
LSQGFASLLDEASVGELIGALAKRGIDTSRLQIPGGSSSQISAASEGQSQVLDTPFTPQTVTSASASSAASTVSSPAAFVPAFQQNLQVTSIYGGSSPLNPLYFATQATAQWIAQKYGTGEVVSGPYEGQGGPFSANGTEYFIKLNNGVLVNAGLLAGYYQRAPEAEFPGVADQQIRMLLASEHGSGAI